MGKVAQVYQWLRNAVLNTLKAAWITTVYLAALSFFAFAFYRFYQETETYKNAVIQKFIFEYNQQAQAQANQPTESVIPE